MEDIRKEQLNILLNGIKKVVSSKNCPEWIARDLTVAVKNAKTRNSENIEKSTNCIEIEETYRPFEVNDKVYFSEFTLCPASGFMPFVPKQYDRVIGDMLNLKTDK